MRLDDAQRIVATRAQMGPQIRIFTVEFIRQLRACYDSDTEKQTERKLLM